MTKRSVISIGNFDGVHLAHRAILSHARKLADQHDARVVVLTFDPHPAAVLRPDARPARLISAEEKRSRLLAAGADDVVLLRPTPDLLGQSAEQFIAHVVRDYQPAVFVEGGDFRFGKGRAGDLATLTRLGEQMDFRVVVEPEVHVALSDLTVVPISSSLVRWLIGQGRPLDAAACLGQPFELTGPIVEGEQRGRRINVPTANLDLAALEDHVVPAHGVYAGFVRLPDGSRQVAAMSVGVKPTFGKRGLAIEAHLLDFAADLYGQTLSFEFTRWVRDQYAFADVDALVAQLKRDIDVVRQWQRLDLIQPPPARPILRPVQRAG